MTRKLRPYTEPPRPRRGLIPGSPDSAAIGFLVMAALWLAAATGMGALLAAQLILPDVIGGFAPVSYGRLQPAFLNALVFGWLTNAAIGSILYITPRLTGRRLFSERLGNLSLGIWNLLGVAPGVSLILLGWTEGRGLAEFIKPVDVAVVLVFILLNVNFWATVASRVDRALYVSLWYFAAALLAFPIIYIVGNVPAMAGSVDALLNAYYVRSLEGYWLLATAVGVLYYVLPRVLDDVLYSEGLAALGFWSFVALFGLSGAQGLVWGPVPYWLQTLSIVASVLLLVPAFAVVANLLLTLRGRWALLVTNPTVQYAVVAVAFLLVTVLLEAILPLRSVSSLVGLTDWLSGVFTIAALGAYSFAFYALMAYAMPRLLRRVPLVRATGRVHLWASFSGTAIAGLTLIAAGLVKGSLFAEGVAFGEVSTAMTPLYATAAAGFGLIGLGALALLVDLFLMYTSGRLVGYEVPTGAAAAPAATTH